MPAFVDSETGRVLVRMPRQLSLDEESNQIVLEPRQQGFRPRRQQAVDDQEKNSNLFVL